MSSVTNNDPTRAFAAGVPSALAVSLRVDAGGFVAGELVAVTVEVRNVSRVPVRVVGVLDGSEVGARYPHYTPSIKGPGYQPPALERPGFTSPLRPQDFRLLDPSEGFDPTARLGGAAYLPLVAFAVFRPRLAGRFELRLTLSTSSADDSEWLGTLPYKQDEALALVAQVPRVTVESNLLVLDVR